MTFDASSTPWVADLNTCLWHLEGECSNLHYMHVELTSMHLIIYSYLVRHLSYSSGRILFSRCGDYIWLSGIYGYCTVEGEKLAIEDVTRNVFQSLQGEIFQLTRELGVPKQLRLFRYDFCLKVA